MNLLRLGPDERRDCTEATESLQKFHLNLQKDPRYGTHRVKTPPSRSQMLDQILMEGDFTPEFKRQIRKSLPRRSFSFDGEAEYTSIPSIDAALSSTDSSHSRSRKEFSRPESKANMQFSTSLATIQESHETQAHGELDKEHQPHTGGEAAAGDGPT